MMASEWCSDMGKPRKIECFSVYGETDTTEGRGPRVVVARFATYEAAVDCTQMQEYYSKHCVWGKKPTMNDAMHLIKYDIITIYDTAAQYAACSNVIDARVKALAKLTPEDRKVLGFE